MKGFILRVIFFLIVGTIVPGIEINGFYAAIGAAFIYGIVNLIFGSLLKIVFFPINLITFGIFNFIINGIIIYFTSYIYKGIEIDSLSTAVLASIILTVLESLYLKD